MAEKACHDETTGALTGDTAATGGDVTGMSDRPTVDLSDFVAFLEERASADAFSGAVAIAKDDSPILERSYGFASKAFNAPNHVDTRFNLGSMNKMFTAVAIAQLVEQGTLSFEDTIGVYLPSYPDHVAGRVTLHHLLTHTSGLGSFWNEAFKAKRVKLRTVQDFLPLFVDDPLQFEPGERFAYSNAGFIVLGAIVEAASGQSYFDYVREHIYLASGMLDTDAFETDQDVPSLAVGYTRMGPDGRHPGPRRSNVHLHTVKGGPAGGGYSTVGDLLRFAAALRSSRLLSPDMSELVLSGKVEMDRGPGTRYGYGFVDTTTNGTRIVGHGGGFPGIAAGLDIYLDRGYTVALLTNYDPDDLKPVTEKLRQMLTVG